MIAEQILALILVAACGGFVLGETWRREVERRRRLERRRRYRQAVRASLEGRP